MASPLQLQASVKVTLVVWDGSVERRRIADGLLRAGFAVCGTHRGDLVPFAPTIDAVVGDPRICPSDLAPVVPIVRPLDLEQLLARVRHTLSETEQSAA